MMTMTTTPSAAHGRASGLLNRLIAACNDGAHAQDRAALVVNGAKRRARLEDSASRRLAFANEPTCRTMRIASTVLARSGMTGTST